MIYARFLEEGLCILHGICTKEQSVLLSLPLVIMESFTPWKMLKFQEETSFVVGTPNELTPKCSYIGFV